MSKLDPMRDPFYARLMFSIEKTICMTDRDAASKGIRLTDSNIKSALNKARHTAPQAAITGLEKVETREDFVMELGLSIAANRRLLLEDSTEAPGLVWRPVSPADWTIAISAVEASLKTRRSTEPGGRSYLDFIHTFVKEMSAKSEPLLEEENR